MSDLKVFKDDNASECLEHYTNKQDMAARLKSVGIRYEQWETSMSIPGGADSDIIMQAYKQEIYGLMAEEGYKTVDVISLTSDHPQKDELRKKFLDEHTHSEDEVRFFVKGQGLFTLHVGNEVFEVLCTQGDLISVPDGTRHWFDMGPNPNFIAIRLFNNPEGWVANYTGNAIALQYSRLEN